MVHLLEKNSYYRYSFNIEIVHQHRLVHLKIFFKVILQVNLYFEYF